jgi:hypothetical protein
MAGEGVKACENGSIIDTVIDIGDEPTYKARILNDFKGNGF